MKTGSSSGLLNIVVALDCEARPLVERFKLKRTYQGAGFVMYGNDRDITLLVSGMGKNAVSAACGYLAGMQSAGGNKSPAWLNIGIAGHQNVPLGEGLIIHKITEQLSGNTYYPSMMLELDCLSCELISVDVPETKYAADAAYDMEGSSYFATASRFATSELVQLFKIVSDNRSESTAQVTEQKIHAWVQEQLESISKIVNQLLTLSSDYNVVYSLPDEYRQLADSVHLSSSHKIRLTEVYRKYYALGGSDLRGQLDHCKYKSAKDLVAAIESLTKSL